MFLKLLLLQLECAILEVFYLKHIGIEALNFTGFVFLLSFICIFGCLDYFKENYKIVS